MTATQLRTTLAANKLSQVDLSKLVGVSPRAVQLWVTGDRSVPNPVEAYLNLLVSLPDDVKAVELYRLRGG